MKNKLPKASQQLNQLTRLGQPLHASYLRAVECCDRCRGVTKLPWSNQTISQCQNDSCECHANRPPLFGNKYNFCPHCGHKL